MSPDLGKTHLSILRGETSQGSLRGKGFVVCCFCQDGNYGFSLAWPLQHWIKQNC